MADYDTLLNTWGATGSVYPSGYNYIEGEQPVDAWDNFFAYNTIEDLSHLISLTNKRVESGSGTSFPSSPNTSHTFYRSDDERLYAWNSTTSTWDGLLKVNGDAMQGDLDLGGHQLTGIGALTLDGNTDLAGNDLKDTTGGNLLYDASAGHIPLGALEESEVTVNSGGHLSGGQTISLGGSLTIDVDDDFLLNTGDRLTGELVGERSSGSRVFTATDSSTGDKLSMRIGGSNTFQLVGYDSSDGAWDYNSALSYDPGSARWKFGSLPSVNGNNIATQNYTNTQIDNRVISPFSENWYSKQEGGTVASGSVVPVGSFNLTDGETLEITQAVLSEDGFTSPAPSGVELVIKADGTSGTTTILSGDGSTLYDDQTGSPHTSYTNTTGSSQTVMIGLDNGHYTAGSGTTTQVYGGYIARVV